jgi:hypothetical protein
MRVAESLPKLDVFATKQTANGAAGGEARGLPAAPRQSAAARRRPTKVKGSRRLLWASPAAMSTSGRYFRLTVYHMIPVLAFTQTAVYIGRG